MALVLVAAGSVITGQLQIKMDNRSIRCNTRKCEVAVAKAITGRTTLYKFPREDLISGSVVRVFRRRIVDISTFKGDAPKKVGYSFSVSFKAENG